MIVRRAHVYRLYPSRDQDAILSRWVGAVRAVYNVALEQRKTFWRPGRHFNFVSQGREVTALRAEFEWLRDVPAQPLHQALRDLDQAFKNLWEGRAGYPSFRKAGIDDAMRFPQNFAFRRLSRRVGEVKLPKLGWVRLRWDRAAAGDIKNVTVARKAGIWTAAAQCEIEINEPVPSTLPEIGIDRGVNLFAALSDGSLIRPLNAGRKALRGLAQAQRRLARKRKGSNNRKKQVRRVARLHARVAAARKDFLHKVSTEIAKSHGTVVIEKLEIRNMVRSAAGTVEKPGRNVRAKAGLNRSILDQGWGLFRVLLGYKLAERGGLLIEVPPQYTSQTCSECGTVDAESREGQRFCCTSCGHEAHADMNAARVILQRGRGTSSLPVEASHQRAGEAGTRRRAA